ncbi:MAG: prolyl oligopeptidase family serine peptidase [Actinomycetaceae bacterium]|nr:prolyl oligopeptidase family serine peptidase [Actinomycetaceae bacterium]
MSAKRVNDSDDNSQYQGPESTSASTDIFTDLAAFVAAPRLSNLVARRTQTGQGATVVAALTRLNQKADAYASALVQLDPEGGQPTPLTRSKKGESLTAIGQRGEIYFSSLRPDEGEEEDVDTALWMLPPRGEARVVLRRPGGVKQVVAAGGKLFCSGSVLPNAKDEDANRQLQKTRKEAGITAILHEDFPVRYWDHDLGPTREALYWAQVPSLDGSDQVQLRPLALPAGKLAGFQVASDGSFVLVTMSRADTGLEERNRVYYLDLTGKPLPLIDLTAEADPLLSVSAGPISPDDQRVFIYASTGNRQGQPLQNWGEIVDIQTGVRQRLDFDNWPGQVTWLDADRFVMTADRLGRGGLYLVTRGQVEPLVEDDFTYADVCALDETRFVASRASIDQPAAPVLVDVRGQVRELQALDAPTPVPGKLEEVSARSEDGTQIRAWLCLPAHIPVGGAPLLTFAHGGPWGSWNSWTWRWNPWPFVARGYAVLLPDPAISTGYGQAMINRGSDAIGAAPYTDILALIDATVERADIDGERTALLGGSYGGYMANWMAGHTGKRFKCIVTHASLWNIDMMARTTDNATWFEWMSTSQAHEYSPHRFADQIQVPMLVIHGDRDYRVPVSQSHALWHALLRDSQVKGHKFLYYPNENHWILNPQNSRIWYETVLAFVDTHVLGKDFARPQELG